MSDLTATPGQTVGPFFHYSLPYEDDSRLVTFTHPQAIRLHGNVFDGTGEPVPDALIELWQPDASGTVVQTAGSLRRDGATFTGWGRCATDPGGHYTFTTLQPGATRPGRPPFFAVTVFARGLLDALFTRDYLPHGDLTGDPLLAALPDADRRTLLCQPEPGGYRFDIHLQGERETVFLRFNPDSQ